MIKYDIWGNNVTLILFSNQVTHTHPSQYIPDYIYTIPLPKIKQGLWGWLKNQCPDEWFFGGGQVYMVTITSLDSAYEVIPL